MEHEIQHRDGRALGVALLVLVAVVLVAGLLYWRLPADTAGQQAALPMPAEEPTSAELRSAPLGATTDVRAEVVHAALDAPPSWVRVRSAGGLPLLGAQVEHADLERDSWRAVGQTDAMGLAELVLAGPRSGRLRASAIGHGAAVVTLREFRSESNVGSRDAPIEIVLSAICEVRGRVRRAVDADGFEGVVAFLVPRTMASDGRIVERALWAYADLERPDADSGDVRAAPVDPATGEFVFAGVPIGLATRCVVLGPGLVSRPLERPVGPCAADLEVPLVPMWWAAVETRGEDGEVLDLRTGLPMGALSVQFPTVDPKIGLLPLLFPSSPWIQVAAELGFLHAFDSGQPDLWMLAMDSPVPPSVQVRVAWPGCPPVSVTAPMEPVPLGPPPVVPLVVDVCQPGANVLVRLTIDGMDEEASGDLLSSLRGGMSFGTLGLIRDNQIAQYSVPAGTRGTLTLRAVPTGDHMVYFRSSSGVIKSLQQSDVPDTFCVEPEGSVLHLRLDPNFGLVRFHHPEPGPLKLMLGPRRGLSTTATGLLRLAGSIDLWWGDPPYGPTALPAELCVLFSTNHGYQLPNSAPFEFEVRRSEIIDVELP